MKNLEIIVISLERATERRAAIRKRLEALDLEFEIFDARNGDQGYQEHFKDINTFTFQIHSRRECLPGEIGCYASHMEVWRRCVQNNRPVVVLEDDAQLTDWLPEALSVAERLIDACGFIRLEANKQSSFPRRYDSVGSMGAFEVNYISRITVSTTGYVISPSAAQRFLSNSETMLATVDRFIQCPWVHHQPLYLLLPSPVARSVVDQGSYIKPEGHSPRKTRALGVMSSIILMKSIYFVRRVLFNASIGRKSRFEVRRVVE